MKQTAVEWLVEQITLPELGDNPQWVQDAIEQAKEMEKEQIIDAYETELYQYKTEISGEQYYNETFKTKQND
jgi:hypothetical protein